eukprot:Skav225135  [mRNA]  locus=scaffold1056:97096:97368:+ [translate_table: standard]
MDLTLYCMFCSVPLRIIKEPATLDGLGAGALRDKEGSLRHSTCSQALVPDALPVAFTGFGSTAFQQRDHWTSTSWMLDFLESWKISSLHS